MADHDRRPVQRAPLPAEVPGEAPAVLGSGLHSLTQKAAVATMFLAPASLERYRQVFASAGVAWPDPTTFIDPHVHASQGWQLWSDRPMWWPDADLAGADLVGADFSGCTLAGADLTGADLRRASLRRADLRRARLSGANLTRADLSGAYLVGADLTDTRLTRARLVRAQICAAEHEMTISSYKWPVDDVNEPFGLARRVRSVLGVELPSIDRTPSPVDLRSADLTGADFTDANFTGAVLRGVDLRGLHLADANFTDADLTGANLARTRAMSSFRRATMAGAVLRRADLVGAFFQDADFTDADLRHARLLYQHGRDSVSNAGRRAGADLDSGTLRGADLSGADLRGAGMGRGVRWWLRAAWTLGWWHPALFHAGLRYSGSTRWSARMKHVLASTAVEVGPGRFEVPDTRD